MKTTTKIYLGIAPLVAGYLMTYGVNTYMSIDNEGRLDSSREAVKGALVGKDILVEFDTMLKFYQEAVIMEDEEMLGTAQGASSHALDGLRKLAKNDGLGKTRQTQSKRIASSLRETKALYDAAVQKIVDGEDDEGTAMQQASDLNKRLQNSREQLVLMTDAMATTVENDLNDIISGGRANRNFSTILFVIIIIVSFVVLSWIISKFISAPLVDMVERIKDIAQGEGDLTQRIQVNSQDEFGELASWFNEFLSKLRNIISSVGTTTEKLSDSSSVLESTAKSMTSSAGETASQATMVADAANDVSDNAQHAATGVDEMGASIREIAKSANDAAMVATQAVQVATSTNITVEKLGTSSIDIGKIIAVITSIAEQTNLLALNATIEAARAGDSGKGFAVVANEVKELAKETAKATDEISAKVSSIQQDAEASISAISKISGTIEQINALQTSIAGAVEEQSATMAEIGRSVGLAADGSSQIASNIMGVATAADGTTEGADKTQVQAQDLGGMAHELQSLVGLFKT